MRDAVRSVVPSEMIPDIRPRVVERSAKWVRRRARNVHRRPLLIFTIGGVAFLVALLSLITLPLRARRVARELVVPTARPDTLAIQRLIAEAHERTRATVAALDSGREFNRRRAAIPIPVDTLSPASRARRDSLIAASQRIAVLVQRAADAPLPTSYRAIAESPDLRGTPRLAPLVDSLNQLEKDRAQLGGPSGVDPVFVAFTARLNAIGKTIEDIAQARRATMGAEIARLAPPALPRVPPPADTASLLAARDSARHDVAALRERLDAARTMSRELDDRAAKARQAAAMGATLPAVLVAALVLGLAAGYAITLLIEMRRPRVADRREAEVLSGLEVLAAVRGSTHRYERLRRRADREIAPVIDQSSDTYQLLYSQLADATFDLPLLAVVGDEAGVVTAVAANLAATAAHEARSALLVGTDFAAQSVAAVLHLEPTPGLGDVLVERVDWVEATRSVIVGRGRTIDVVTAGSPLGRTTLPGAVATLRAELERRARRYESIIVSAPLLADGSSSPLLEAVPRVLVSVRPGRTPVARLRRLVSTLAAGGWEVAGLVTWELPDPERHQLSTDVIPDLREVVRAAFVTGKA